MMNNFAVGCLLACIVWMQVTPSYTSTHMLSSVKLHKPLNGLDIYSHATDTPCEATHLCRFITSYALHTEEVVEALEYFVFMLTVGGWRAGKSSAALRVRGSDPWILFPSWTSAWCAARMSLSC